MKTHCPSHPDYNKTCQHCKEYGRTRAARRRKLLHLHGGNLHVPALGTQRRLQALAYNGWSARQLRELGGFSVHTLHDLTAGEYDKIDKRLAAKVAAFYEANCAVIHCTTPAQKRVRTVAKRKGWAPPFAWDDIDDPFDQPQGMVAEDKPRSHAEEGAVRLEEYLFLRSQGLSDALIAERLNIKIDTIGALKRRLERRAA